MRYDIKPIPDNSFVVRGYSSSELLDYCGLCLVEPREKGEWEICKWIVKNNAPRDYIPEAIKEIKKVFNPVKLTGTAEKTRYQKYQRYLQKYGLEIPVLKEFAAEHNGVTGQFVYVELKEKG